MLSTSLHIITPIISGYTTQPWLHSRGRGEHEASCALQHNAHARTTANAGGGFPRQKLESVQVALRSIDTLLFSLSCSSSGGSAPAFSTRSRQVGESPAMLPSAHTACVHMHMGSGGEVGGVDQKENDHAQERGGVRR